MEPKKVIVFGGSGLYGRKVAQSLLNHGQFVRVVSRDAKSARKTLGTRVDLFEGDVTEPNTIHESLKGMDSVVICLSAMKLALFRKAKAIELDAVLTILEETQKAGIARLVYLSGYELRGDLLKKLNIYDFGEIKIEVEKQIRQTNLNWTILGASPSFDIFFAFVRKGTLAIPGGGYAPIPSISPEDVGEITAQTVIRDDLKGRRLKLTGPEAINFPEAARRLAAFSGKNITHRAIPLGVVNVATFLIQPFLPFPRYLYKSLLLLNHFPKDLTDNVKNDYQILRDLFDYEPVTLDMEIQRRVNENKI